MKTPGAWRTLACLITDTFRQARASGILWILLAISALAIMVCATASIHSPPALAADGETVEFLPRGDRDAQDLAKLQASGVAVTGGELTLAFGAVRVPLARDARGAVRFVELILAGGVADTFGLLLTLVWTAGFLPGFLETRSVAVLLAKPVPRWWLLLGKFVGVLSFVLASGSLFVGGSWLALGLRTGIWDASYLLAVPLLLLHFAMFFSVSACLAVWTQSTVLCVFGSIVFWCLAWSINFGRHTLAVARDALPAGAFADGFGSVLEAAYWILPKPADINLLLFNMLGAENDFGRLFSWDALAANGFSFGWSIATSLVFTVAALTVAGRKFESLDY